MADPRGTRRWRQLRATILSTDDTCHLCGKPGADTLDHVREIALGADPWDITNLRPAHGRKQPGCPGNYGRSNNITRTPNTSRAW